LKDEEGWAGREREEGGGKEGREGEAEE